MLRQPDRRWFFPLVVAGAATVAIGCAADDSTATPTVPPANASRVMTNAAVADDSAWDTLVADVTVIPTRVDTAGRRRRYPATSYHIERRRGQDGWSTVVTFAPRVRARTRQGSKPFDPEATEMTRLETDEHGRLRIFNGHGQEFHQPDRAELAALLRRIVPDTARPIPSAPRGTSNGAAPHAGSGWVQEYLASMADAPARNARIARLWGTSQETRNGLAVYRHDDAKAHRELQLDSSTGLPVHLVTTRGEVSHTVDYVYDRSSDGAIVHRSTHSETTHGKAASITDVTYSNVRLEKRG